MNPSLTFDPSDGSASISGIPIRLRGGLSREAVPSALVSFYRSTLNHGNGYEWLSFHGVTFGGHPCGFALCFFHGSMTQLHFSVMLPNTEIESGWPTKGAIDDEIAFVRKELSAQLRTTIADHGSTFSWGVAWSTFDPRGFQASSGVRYTG
ncbi:MAG: hypothetical protein ACREP4_12900 [Stenotrophomonas sp.]|uniref:hypothetical protein n=1 Tax=Stenotrophomonas sp. TaxID=69392 RepID=UPI003D6D89A1